MLSLRGWTLLVLGSAVGSVRSAALPTPAITTAPRCADVDIRSLEKRQVPDAISLAEVLLTALPLSLRLIAATNVPAVSSILWEEFLDDKKPEWFLELPSDIQNYLVRQFGPQTAWPTATPEVTVTGQPSQSNVWTSDAMSSSTAGSSVSSASDSSSTTSASSTSTAESSRSSSRASSSSLSSTHSSSRTSTTSSSPTSSATSDPVAPASSDSGLTKRQKIGLGVGVPFALLSVAALLFACCFLHRRRRRHIEGSQPPSSPGFIPRFSFQDRGLSSEHFEHRAPLNPGFNRSSQDVGAMNWEDDGYDPAEMEPTCTCPPGAAPMAMHDPKPIMAPALFHTHSSNRARGKRTSYTNLHSVAEVTEPDDEMMESPVLGRHSPPKHTQTLRRLSTPLHMEMPPVPAMATIKRKPLATSPTSSPAAEAASRSLLRPSLTMPNNTGSSSSGAAISSLSTSSSLNGHGYQSDMSSSPISPLSHHHAAPTNPFARGYDYLEDYGPEYSNNGYSDLENGLYGGNRSLDRYPDPSSSSSPPKSSKTEWPLKNIVGMGHRRDRSPMWDRVYENVYEM